MAKITLEEKKLQVLYRQLYGNLGAPKNAVQEFGGSKQTTSNPKINHSSLDLSYLKKDLYRIFILTLFAFSLQLLLYFGAKNGFLNLNFF